MLMYLRLIIRESQKFNGMGWLTYDSLFRQNNAGRGSRWNVLDPSLHTDHIVQGGLRVIPCRICSGVDHSPEECAVAPLVPEVRPTRPRTNRVENRTATPFSQTRICLSWNRGQCRFPGSCFFRHVCLTCEGKHKQKECEAGRQGFRGPPRMGQKYEVQRKL